MWDRASASLFRPPKPKAETADEREPTEQEKAAAVRQVDPLERKVGYLGAALIAIVGILAFVPFIDNPNKPVVHTEKRVGNSCPQFYTKIVVKGVNDCTANLVYSRGHWVLYLMVVVFFAVFVAVAVKIGRRSVVAFALLMSGLAVEALTGSILGILFVGAGGWLVMRAFRVQRYGSPNAKDVAAARGVGKGSSSTPARNKKKSDALDDDTRKPPTSNKRYTPKGELKKKP